MSIRVSCQCGKALNVKDEFAGKKIKCPGCATTIAVGVPTTTAKATATARQASSGASQGSAFDVSAIGEMLADEGFGEPTGETCPVCSTALLGGWVHCGKCGHELKYAAPASSDPDDTTQTPAAKPKRISKRARMIATVSAGVVLIASSATAIGMYILGSGDPPSSTLVASVPAEKIELPVVSKVSGMWYGQHDLGDGMTESWLTLETDGDKLSGAIKVGEFPEIPFDGGSVKDNTFSFVLAIPYDGDLVTSTTTGTVSGDTLVGTASVLRNEEVTEAKFTSKRLADSVVTGTWHGNHDIGDGMMESWMTLKAYGDKLAGTIKIGEFPEMPIDGGSVQGNTFTFSLSVPYEGEIATSTTKGNVQGDTLTGSVSVSRNEETTEAEFTSTRLKEDAVKPEKGDAP